MKLMVKKFIQLTGKKILVKLKLIGKKLPKQKLTVKKRLIKLKLIKQN